MDLKESRKLVAYLSDMYPGRITDPGIATGYQIMLDDVPYAAVMAVIKTICMSSPNHPPTAPAIARYMESLIKPRGDASAAWERTLKAGIRCSARDPQCAYRFVADPATEHAIRTVGWERIATTDYSQHGTLFAQFRAAYESGIEGGTIEESRNMLTRAQIAHALGEPHPYVDDRALPEGDDDAD